MRSRRFVAAALVPLLASLLPSPTPAQGPDTATLLTRPERTEYRETTRYDEVVALMREAARRAPDRIRLTTFGHSWEGRPLPLAVVGRVADASPAAVKASGRLRVYLQGNIHAGEVEGKEALLTLLREVAEGRHGGWADSLVLLVAPILNADGNERVNLGNRPGQLGPVGGMGQRPNAQGLDLNRDHVKLESPEARSFVRLLNEYDPQVSMDLHTTNGTFHAYRLTYAPPLHPNTPASIDRLLRERWLPEVTRTLKAAHGWDVYHYGNVPTPESPWAAAEGAERGWYSYDSRPRFGTNYAGLRGRVAILSEAFSYLPFPERIAVTRRFVDASLDWARAHAPEVRRALEEARCAPVAGRTLALTSRLRRSEAPVEILMGAVDTVHHPLTGAPMYRRRDVVRPERMPQWIAFEAVETERAPAFYLVPAELGAALERLAAHGIRAERLERAAEMEVEVFRIDSTAAAAQEFQGHRTRQVWGRWERARRAVPAGMLRVPADQGRGTLVFTLLEPRSEDGLVTWNVLDRALEGASAYPILRVPGERSSVTAVLSGCVRGVGRPEAAMRRPVRGGTGTGPAADGVHTAD